MIANFYRDNGKGRTVKFKTLNLDVLPMPRMKIKVGHRFYVVNLIYFDMEKVEYNIFLV